MDWDTIVDFLPPDSSERLNTLARRCEDIARFPADLDIDPIDIDHLDLDMDWNLEGIYACDDFLPGRDIEFRHEDFALTSILPFPFAPYVDVGDHSYSLPPTASPTPVDSPQEEVTCVRLEVISDVETSRASSRLKETALLGGAASARIREPTCAKRKAERERPTKRKTEKEKPTKRKTEKEKPTKRKTEREKPTKRKTEREKPTKRKKARKYESDEDDPNYDDSDYEEDSTGRSGPCDLCLAAGGQSKVFKRLDRHKARQHSTQELPFPCKLCAKAFRQRIQLQNHLQTHPETKDITRTFPCSCGKVLSRKDKLKDHLLKYQCDQIVVSAVPWRINQQ